jgi:hypothetical protein
VQFVTSYGSHHSQGNPTPLLQYDSVPCSDLRAKILGADTSLFLFTAQFNFPLSSLLLHESDKRKALNAVRDLSWQCVCLHCERQRPDPQRGNSSIAIYTMILEAMKVHWFFHSLQLFTLFFLYLHSRTSTVEPVSQREKLETVSLLSISTMSPKFQEKQNQTPTVKKKISSKRQSDFWWNSRSWWTVKK